MSRLSLRVRLTLAFALAMAAVLTAVGALLYMRLGDSLLEQVDDDLEARAPAIEALVAVDGLGARQFTTEEGLIQVLGPGARLESYPPLAAPVLTAAERRRAEGGQFFLTRRSVPSVEGPVRLHIAPGDLDGEPFVLVVGASLEDREEALDGLLAQLLVVGPLALLLSSLLGYALAGAALRPVEAMRRRAAEISTAGHGQRLPLPRADDELGRLGRTLNDMLARLEAGLARERRFVADTSHELRTPLATLRAELELAARRPRSREELEEVLRSAREEVERLVRLAEDLLVLARAGDGRLPLRLERHSARELLDAVAGRFDARAEASGRSLEVVVPEDSTFTGDRLRLEQALGNLVDNALRHGAGAVRLGAVSGNGVLELRVWDEGAGFPPDFLPHAFERFSRADVAREGAGAGLGLALAEAIASAHGGGARAENRTAGGAEVVLSIAPAGPPGDPHRPLI